MNKEEKESALHFLNSLKWPKNQSGYLVSSESDLPPYRILSKMLHEANIPPPVTITWNKAQCIEALGGIEVVQQYMQNVQTNYTIDNLCAIIQNELNLQKQYTDEIEQLTQGNSETLLELIQNDENNLIDQQQQMFS